MRRRKFAFRFLAGALGSFGGARFFSSERSGSRPSRSAVDHTVTFVTPKSVFNDKSAKWENSEAFKKITDRYLASGDILKKSFREVGDECQLTLQFKSELAYWRWEKDLSAYSVFDYKNGAEKVQRIFKS